MRFILRTAGVAATMVALTACAYRGPASLPLPGGAGGSDGYLVTTVVPDAGNLVERETCRSNNVVIGSVEAISLNPDLTARIRCRIRKDVALPANVSASIKQTSLLGEPFVSLDSPDGGGTGHLASGATVPNAPVGLEPNTEVVLSALSQVLNGSGLANLETITRELGTALGQSNTADTVNKLQEVVAELNASRGDITASLEQLDRFAGALANQRASIASALDNIPGGLAVLNRQRDNAIKTLASLSHLSEVAGPVIAQSRDATAADLAALQPVLAQLGKVGDQLAPTVERLASFPFPHDALSFIRGDYAGNYITLSLDLTTLSQLLAAPTKTQSALPTVPKTGTAPSTVSGPLGLPLPLPSGASGNNYSGLLGGLVGGL